MVVEGRIAEYLDRKGIKQCHVSQNADIEQARLSRVLNGSGSMSVDEYERVCNALEVSPNTFMIMTFQNE